jgi:hypothetical protein
VTEVLANARAAWDAKSYDAAESFYKNALDRGGLSPSETVDCYAHLGAARAALRKNDLARAAFRQAARIDPRFRVPPDASRKATQIATMARRDEAKMGAIVLRAQVPTTVAANAPFNVDATLDAKHAASVVARVGVDARDTVTGKHFIHSDVASSREHFEIPAEVAVSGATLVVRIDALDAHDNRLASREHRVQVEKAPEPPPPPAPPPPVAAAPAATGGPRLGLFEPVPATPAPREGDATKDKGSSKGGGFWSSPWPYVIGGLALAAGGVTVYVMTRPTDDVSVGSARVQTR